jgi:lysophospholipase L1-like esterase
MDVEPIVFSQEEQEKLNRMFEQWMADDQKRKLERFRELNCSVRSGATVFVGDSIIEAYPLSELFPSGFDLYNRGISGITSGQLLEHLDEHIIALKPVRVFLLIGTNDVERGVPSATVGENVREICQRTLLSFPLAKVFVMLVFPINATGQFLGTIGKRTNDQIGKVNRELLRRLSGMDGVVTLDLTDTLSTGGDLRKAFTFDGLHLTIAGFRAVTARLLPCL